MNDGTLVQKKPMLSTDQCLQILNYQIPTSTVKGEDKEIEDIFRRINSFGRQLSRQEIRQAGAVGLFPDLVRKIASQIRSDVSPSDLIELSKMREISLSNISLEYGININEVFWVKQHIVTVPNMRKSRDEELIAWIMSYILLGSSIQPSANCLDSLYRYEETEYKGLAIKADEAINKMGFDNLLKWFTITFDNLCTILSESGKTFYGLLFEKDGEGLVRSFQIVFLAFYQLIIKENKKISDVEGLANSLTGLGSNLFKGISDSTWNAKFRNTKIDAFIGIVGKYFSNNDSYKDDTTYYWVSQLETLLSQSRIEGSQYDFKIGFHMMDGKSNPFAKDLVEKIVKTLTAMANKGKGSKGYVIVGIADKEEDAKRHSSIYGSKYTPYKNGNYFITGLNAEEAKYKKIDEYIGKIKSAIEGCPVDKGVIDNILSNMKHVSYYNKDILVLEIVAGNSPTKYDKKLWIRRGNSVEEVTDVEGILAVGQRFN